MDVAAHAQWEVWKRAKYLLPPPKFHFPSSLDVILKHTGSRIQPSYKGSDSFVEVDQQQVGLLTPSSPRIHAHSTYSPVSLLLQSLPQRLQQRGHQVGTHGQAAGQADMQRRRGCCRLRCEADRSSGI